jgi:hypothetical protein
MMSDEIRIAELKALILEDRLAGAEGNLVIARFMEMLTIRSLEANVPTIETLIARCMEAGHRSLETAFFHDGISIFAPDTGSEHFIALAFEKGRDKQVAICEFSTKPDPEFDAIFDKIMKEMAAKRGKIFVPSQEPKVREIRHVYVLDYGASKDYGSHRDLNEAFSFIANNGTCTREFLRSDSSTFSETKQEWTQSGRLSHLDNWKTFFGYLRSAIDGIQVHDFHEQSASAFSKRHYWLAEEKVSKYWGATSRLAELVARQENYLPGQCADAMMRDILKKLMESELSGYLQYLRNVVDSCNEFDHSSQEGRFTYNDLDNSVFSRPVEDGSEVILHFNDQNRDFAVILSVSAEDKLGRFIAYDVGGLADRFSQTSFPSSRMLCTFTLDPDNQTVQLTSTPKLDQDSIRGWNSLLADIEGAAIEFDLHRDELSRSRRSP